MIPTDTISPVTPDRSRVRFNAECPRADTMAHSRAAVVRQAGDHHDPERPVVEDRVDQDQQQSADAGQQPGLERRLAQGGRHRLWSG